MYFTKYVCYATCFLMSQVDKKQSNKAQRKYAAREKMSEVEQPLENQFTNGKVLGKYSTNCLNLSLHTSWGLVFSILKPKNLFSTLTFTWNGACKTPILT